MNLLRMKYKIPIYDDGRFKRDVVISTLVTFLKTDTLVSVIEKGRNQIKISGICDNMNYDTGEIELVSFRYLSL